MKINKKNYQLIGILILFAIVYIFIAVRPARNSFQFVPQWTIDIENASIKPSNESLYPFKLGKTLGYYTSEGEIASITSLEERGSISNHYMAPYKTDDNEISFFIAQGTQSGVIKKEGFPFFDEDRIFLFYPSGNSFSYHSSNGSELWSFENYVPITSFYSNTKGVVVGYADGEIVILDLDGTVLQEYYPGGSEYEIIYGAAMSNSAQYAACVSGLDKQRFVVSDIKGSTSKIIFHVYLENPVLEQSFVYFSQDEKYVFANGKDILVAIDINEKQEKIIPLVGKVVAIKEVHNGDYYFVLSKYRGKSSVSVFNKYLHSVGSFTFDEENTFIDSDTENVYIGNGTTISKLFVKDK